MFGKPYARGGAVFPGTFVRVLKIEGKCSCLRAKAAHISGHLPNISATYARSTISSPSS